MLFARILPRISVAAAVRDATPSLLQGHSESPLFTVACVGKDQVESYAAHKGLKVSEVQR